MKETKNTTATDIRQLVTAAKEQMSKRGYRQCSINRMDAVWNDLIDYCEEYNGGLLTAESTRSFV